MEKILDENGNCKAWRFTEEDLILHKKLNIRKFTEEEREELKKSYNELKVGDSVKIRSNVLEFINHDRFNLLCYKSPHYNHINETWFLPFEEKLEQVKDEIFVIDDFIMHQLMGKCCYVGNDKCGRRLPIDWIQKV